MAPASTRTWTQIIGKEADFGDRGPTTNRGPVADVQEAGPEPAKAHTVKPSAGGFTAVKQPLVPGFKLVRPYVAN
jgi:hypothetical protein